MEQLDFIRHAGETRRFHTWPVLREQNVAAHSWHVTMLLWLMYGQEEPGISIALLMAGMTHDMAECKVGDIPSPAKRDMETRLQLKGAQTFRAAWGEMEQDLLREHQMDWEGQLSVEELRKLKLADAMEGALYCINERAMGNTLIAPCYVNFHSYISELLPDDGAYLETEHDVFQYIVNQWEQVNGGE